MTRRAPGAGSYREKSPGIWEIRLTLADGARRSRTVPAADEPALLAILNGVLEELADGNVAPVGGLTLRVTSDRFIQRLKAERSRSYKVYEGRWRNHILDAPFIDELLPNITQRAVRAWGKSLKSKRVKYTKSLRTITARGAKQIVGLLSTIFSDAIDEGLIDTNPALGLKAQRGSTKSTKKKWDVLTSSEIVALETSHGLTEAERARLLFAIGTGLRAGEQFALRLADVHLDGLQPYVRVRFGTPNGPPKSGEERDVWLFGIGLDAARQQVELVKGLPNKHALLFPDLDGDFYPSKNLVEWLRPRLAVVGVKRRMLWHWLRHTFATATICGFWGEHWPIAMVGGQLGHSGTYMTETYAHLLPSAVAEQAEKTQRAMIAKGTAKGTAVVAVQDQLETEVVGCEERQRSGFSEFALKLLKLLEAMDAEGGKSPSHLLQTAHAIILTTASGAVVLGEECDSFSSESLASPLVNYAILRAALRTLTAEPDHKMGRALALASLIHQAATAPDSRSSGGAR